jgi:hypothetical protein
MAVCLLLLFLGGSDLKILFENPHPHQVALAALVRGEVPGAWLTVEGGMLDLTEAINMSGSIDIDAFLIPLQQDRNDHSLRVIVETRDPQIIETLSTYYFRLDNEAERQQFFTRNQERFYLRKEITGMLAGGLVASGNRDNLASLAKQLGMAVPDDVIFLSEGKTPARWRGWFFTAVGLFGLARLLFSKKAKPAA